MEFKPTSIDWIYLDEIYNLIIFFMYKPPKVLCKPRMELVLFYYFFQASTSETTLLKINNNIRVLKGHRWDKFIENK